MTYSEREKIFSKDVISTSELARLLDCNIATASTTLVDIKDSIVRNGGKPRITARGKLHVQDYCDFYRIKRREL
ncbi:MAG: hypothetical protein ACI4MZ_03725 [Christensenellales bacterium]